MNTLNFIDRFHIWRKKIKWNRQYRNGKWDYLKTEKEALRYAKISEIIKTYSQEKPHVLDLGSGEGVLRMVLDPLNLGYFYGVDFSKVSIEKALQNKFKNTDFQVADLHYYTPAQDFDTIVFNEAFYYINTTVKAKVVNRILSKLKKDGILITSIFGEGTGCWEYFDIPELEQIEFSKVDSKNGNTSWKIGVYRKT